MTGLIRQVNVITEEREVFALEYHVTERGGHPSRYGVKLISRKLSTGEKQEREEANLCVTACEAAGIAEMMADGEVTIVTFDDIIHDLRYERKEQEINMISTGAAG